MKWDIRLCSQISLNFPLLVIQKIEDNELINSHNLRLTDRGTGCLGVDWHELCCDNLFFWALIEVFFNWWKRLLIIEFLSQFHHLILHPRLLFLTHYLWIRFYLDQTWICYDIFEDVIIFLLFNNLIIY